MTAGPTDFDANKIAVDLAHLLIKDTGKGIATSVRDFFGRIKDALFKDLTPYIEATLKKCSWVKTLIINREGPTFIGDIYVKTRISVRSKIVDDSEFISELSSLRSVVVQGSGGSGKSMLMRHLFISLCKNSIGKLPLFIELRTLNTFNTKDLAAFIFNSIRLPGAIFTREQFDAGMKAGSFCIILDGFDEVDADQRQDIEKQILALRESCPDLILIVSSRPDPENRFQSWPKFHVCKVQPMTRDQVTELIDKLDYDSQVKNKFLKALDSLFKTHSSFLSNPLLCIMMLITFEQYGHIPDKMHIFYEHAFDALFFRHDASKEGLYRRKTHGNLPIDEFRDCLSAFCIVSYSNERFTFTNTEVRETIKNAMKLERKSVEPNDFLNDLIENVCLLQVEGLQYQFTHRSFQEYFAATFIARSPTSSIATMLDQFCKRRQDQVVPMAFAMNRKLLEREWVLPKMRECVRLSQAIDPKKNPIEYANVVFGGLSLHHRGKSDGEFMYLAALSPLGEVMLTLRDLYSASFDVPNKRKDTAVIKAALSKMVESGDSRLTLMGANRIRSGQIVLQGSDTSWVKKTRVPIIFDHYKMATNKLLSELEKSVEEQSDALASFL